MSSLPSLPSPPSIPALSFFHPPPAGYQRCPVRTIYPPPRLQDTNAAQYALVKLLCGPGSSTFVVGDPDQVSVGAVVWRKCGDGAAWGWAATPRHALGVD